ncbi:hypothetical protein BVY04_00175 [bacterium M21]|nr:hypothetical protein BVY04_00175 [bacterium M21]
MRNRASGLLVILLSFVTLFIVNGEEKKAIPGATIEDYQWWREARFGVFVCWSPAAVLNLGAGGWDRGPGPNGYPLKTGVAENATKDPIPAEILNGEWKKRMNAHKVPMNVFDNLYRVFNPTSFDADSWARTFKEAGARYVVFTIKHHDGFCMYDSKYTDYDIMSTPYGKDVAKEVADACHKHGLKLIWYYSTGDWYELSFNKNNPKPYADYLHNQIEELFTNYGEIAGVWWDGFAAGIKFEIPRLYSMMRRLQPGCIYNGRIEGPPPIAFSTPEQRLGNFNMNVPWEMCAITHGVDWFWAGGRDMKSYNVCLRMLIDCAGGDGNLLLDFGPQADGTIDSIVKQIYLDMGKWLGKYGESIYSTRGGPYKPGHWGVSTRSGNTIYLHITQKWPGGTLTLPALPAKVISWTALTGGIPSVSQAADSLTVRLDEKHHLSPDTIIALTIDKPAMEIEPIDTIQKHSLSMDAKVASSSHVVRNSGRGIPESVVQYSWESGHITKHFGEDGDADPKKVGNRKSKPIVNAELKKKLRFHRGHVWRYWEAGKDDPTPWLEVNTDTPTTFQQIVITEQYSRVRGYELQYHNGADWLTIDSSHALDNLSIQLPQPVTASRVRLLINKTNGEPPRVQTFDLF